MEKTLKNDSTTDREIENELNLIKFRYLEVHTGKFVKINILNYSVAQSLAFQANDIF